VIEQQFVCLGGFGFEGNPSDIWVSDDGADWTQISDSPWNNDPSPECVEDSPTVTCDNIRYDFDMLTVKDGDNGMAPMIMTFGGDREMFAIPPNAPPEDNWTRIENDVWRFATTAGFNIGPGLNGNWWSGADRNGEGAQVEVADDGDGNMVFVATIYTYDPMGNQIFLLAVGRPVEGGSVDMDVFITEGGAWGADFDPENVMMPQWGTGTATGHNCGSLNLDLMPNAGYQDIGYTAVNLELVRLTTPLIPCPMMAADE
jgi:hypothetical protein